jgi:hypothetical protein
MARRPADPTESTAKKVLLLNGNRCAFQNVDSGTSCENELARPEWERPRVELAHISGASPGGPRYDATVSDEERRAYENIIPMCPTHAYHIDYVQPLKYTADVLLEMKRRQEERADSSSWASDELLTRSARLVLVHQFGEVVVAAGNHDSDLAPAAEGAAYTARQPDLAVTAGLGDSLAGLRPVAGQTVTDSAAATDSASGSGEAHDAAVEAIQADAKFGDVTVSASAAGETAEARARILLEDGGSLLTEDGDAILLEGSADERQPPTSFYDVPEDKFGP